MGGYKIQAGCDKMGRQEIQAGVKILPIEDWGGNQDTRRQII